MTFPVPFGKYLLLEPLPSSPLTEVFAAREAGVAGMHRIVSIKRLQPNAAEDAEVREAFLDEARVSLSLSHASIVQMLEVSQAEDSYYLALEYVSGRSLEAVLNALGDQALDAAQALFIAIRVCEALEHAHRKKGPGGAPLNVVHRGVAPANVHLSWEGEVKLAEFGLAKAANRLQRTQVGVLKGMVGYMSPEQVRGEAVDRRSDLFALGLVLYQLVTGRRAFEAETEFALMEQVARGVVVPPVEWNPLVWDRLSEIILKALAPDPADRYQWASDLHADLSRELLNSPFPCTAISLSEWLRSTFPDEHRAEEARLARWTSAQPAAPELGRSRPATRPGGRAAAPAPSPGVAAPARPASRGGSGPRPPPSAAFPRVTAAPTAPTLAAARDDDDEDELPAPTQMVNVAEVMGNAPPALSVEAPPWGEVLPFDDDDDPATAPVIFAPAVLPPRQTPAPLPAVAQEAPPLPPRRSRAPLWASLAVLVLGLAAVAGWALTQRPQPSLTTVLVRVSPEVAGTQVTMSGRLIQSNAVSTFPPGEYDLLVTAPGHRAHAQRVTIFPNEPEAVLSVFLQAETAAPVDPPPLEEKPAPTLAVTFDAPAGAELSLDGRPLGTAPLPGPERLELGRSYAWTAQKSGFEERSGTIDAAAPGEQTVKVVLEPVQKAVRNPRPPPVRGQGFLVLNSDPEGAMVWVDGKPTQRRTPVRASDPLKLPAGRRKVVVDLGGMTSEVLVVQIKAGETVTLRDVVLDQLSDL